MFREVQKNLNFPQLEEKILEYWKEHKIFEKSLEQTKDGENFAFYEGPPTANGKPGIHHVMARTVKDIVCRHKTMKGFFVNRKAGWDTHGLPVEIEVEKQLKINGKDQIEKFGVVEFNKKCKESVFEYKTDWDELTERIGYWLDLDDPYITFTNDYIESVWWILKQMWDKGMIYQGFKILPYCPRCGTPLSSHEVSQGYKEVKDPSIYVRVEQEDEPGTYFLLWTTTPWTLISNVALAVGPDIDYVKLEHESEKYIMAEARVEDIFADGTYKVLEKFKGDRLENLRYKRMFDFVPVDKDAFYVTLGDFVSTEDGTGIVHMAPAFGEDDYQLSLKYDLPLIRPVDAAGAFVPEVKDYAGQFVKEADPEIIKDLKIRGQMVKKITIEHSYPHCWRCHSPLLYYARESWNISTSKMQQALLKNNALINWNPPEIGERRFGDWLKNAKDWSLSRDRYWGTPLNIWLCADCGHMDAAGSVDELFEKAVNLDEKERETLDLHKPFVDKIEFKCEKCSGTMHRTPEVIDCWFDSGSMPVAQWHYPFENKEMFEKNFPADFICEGIDQTRGWFYSLLAISTIIFDEPAFKNIIVNELILDKKGQKMSKTRGNAVVPEEMIQKYGADAIRWYLMTVSTPWIPKKFDTAGVGEVQRKFINTLMNSYSFFILYANIDKFDPKREAVPFESRLEIDRWVLSKLYSVIDQAGEFIDQYDLTRAARLISDYVIDDVSNWYVRRNRRRFWKSGDSEDKLAAYQTLYEVLLSVSKLTAPFIPFVSEELFLNLTEEKESVHLCSYPQVSNEQKKYINKDLEDKMALAQRVVGMARALRNEAQIKVRQPLSELIFISKSETERSYIKEMAKIISDELNVKQVSFAEDASLVVELQAKPNFKILGAKAGKLMGRLTERIKNFDQEQIASFLSNGYEHVFIDGREFRLEPDDVEITSLAKENFAAQTDQGITTALNTELDEALLQEGMAREFVNRIQNMRKETGFDVTDKIIIEIENIPDDIAAAVETQQEYICSETLADSIRSNGISADFKKEIEINQSVFTIGLVKK